MDEGKSNIGSSSFNNNNNHNTINNGNKLLITFTNLLVIKRIHTTITILFYLLLLAQPKFNLDSRNVKRGKCTKCDCDPYEYAPPNNDCNYCKHGVTEHINIENPTTHPENSGR